MLRWPQAGPGEELGTRASGETGLNIESEGSGEQWQVAAPGRAGGAHDSVAQSSAELMPLHTCNL